MTRPILLSLLSLGLAAQTAVAQDPKTQPASPAAAQVANPPAAQTPTPVPPAARPPVPVPRPAMPPPAPPKEEAIPPEQVLGRIGTQVFHERDFERWLTVLAGAKRFEQMSKAPGGLTRFRQQFLDGQVLAAKARKAGLQQLPEFKEELRIQEDQVLVKLLMNEERTGSEGQRLKERIENPSEDEIKAYFDKNAQRYETPEKFTARHILVGTKGSPRMGDKGLGEEEAKAKIAKIQGELAAGKKFEDLAKEYSDDPSNKNTGGLIKDASFGGFVKEFEEAVRQQEIGKVGEPVKTPFGYHLIMVEGRTPKQPAVLEQVRERVKQQLLPERREAAYKEFLDQARAQVDFVAGPEAAASLPKATARPAAAKRPAKP